MCILGMRAGSCLWINLTSSIHSSIFSAIYTCVNYCDLPIQAINNWQALKKLLKKQSSGWAGDSLQPPHLAAQRQGPLQLLVPTTTKLSETFQASGSCKYFECRIHMEHNWEIECSAVNGSCSEKMQVLLEQMLSVFLLVKTSVLAHSQVFTFFSHF